MKSYAIELDENEEEYIKAVWDCQTDAEVRRILQSFVAEKLPIDVGLSLKKIRAPYASGKRGCR